MAGRACAAIEDQMTNPYFPVDMSAMASARHFFDLDESPVNIHGAVVSSVPLNHPQGCVGYRIEADGGRFVYATDTEPGSPRHDRALADFVKGADVLVYDAQFTPEQLAREKKGWGHSSWLEGTKLAIEAGVKQIILFHHDPDSEDAFIDGLVEKAQQDFPAVAAAAEGLELYLPEKEALRGQGPKSAERRRSRRYPIEMPVQVRWRGPEGSFREVLAYSKDISRSGIHLIASSDIPADQPLEIELVLPDEITHRGDAVFRYTALPVRREQLTGDHEAPGPTMRLAARLKLPEGNGAETRAAAEKTPENKQKRGPRSASHLIR